MMISLHPQKILINWQRLENHYEADISKKDIPDIHSRSKHKGGNCVLLWGEGVTHNPHHWITVESLKVEIYQSMFLH